MNKLIIPVIIILILIAGIGIYFVFQEPDITKVTNFKQCAKAGYLILETHPRQCKTSDGRQFVEEIEKYQETKKVCEAGGAEYRKFASSCRDQCWITQTEYECKSPESYGCDCSPDKCWNGTDCELNKESQKICVEQGGTICSLSESCPGSCLRAFDTGRCCSEECS